MTLRTVRLVAVIQQGLRRRPIIASARCVGSTWHPIYPQQQQQQQHRLLTTTGTSSSSVSPSLATTAPPPRPWLDPKLSLQVRVQRFCQSPLGTLNPRAVSFDAQTLMDTCCRRRDVKLAQRILDRVLEEKEHQDSIGDNSTPFVVPLDLFQTLLYGWACMVRQTKQPQQSQLAVKQMRKIIDTLFYVLKQEHEEFPESLSLSVQPTTNLFNTYLTGLDYASPSNPTAAKLAEQFLDEMANYHQQHGWHTKPNTKSLTLVISAHLHNSSDTKRAGVHAERVLHKLQQIHEQEKELYQQQYQIPYNTREPQLNKRRIPTADVVVYNAVIQAYGKDPSQKGAQKARDLFIEALAKDDGTVQADWALLTSVIAAFGNVAGNPRLDKSIRYQLAEQAEELWNLASRDLESRLFLDATAESNDAMDDDNNPDDSDYDNHMKGSKYQLHMNRVAPVNACMNAYARTDSLEGAIKAETMLQELLTDCVDKNGTTVPDTVSFNTVLQAWSRLCPSQQNAAQKAEELLQLQRKLFATGALGPNAMPDVWSFSIVMAAHARSKDPNKVATNNRLLQELLQGLDDGTVKGGSNNINNSSNNNIAVAFTAVLNAAAHPATPKKRRHDKDKATESNVVSPFGGGTDDGPVNNSKTNGIDEGPNEDNAYAIVLRTYRELKEDAHGVGCRPDHFAFASMLHCVGVYTHPTSAERRQMLQVVFEDACEAGQVSKLVVKALYKECPNQALLAEMLREPELVQQAMLSNVSQLPKEWTRHVPHQHRDMGRSAQRKKKKEVSTTN